MPISACVGRASVMDAWPVSHGEALHTQTFLGHPPGCAAALAALAVIDEEKLAARAAELGAVALAFLRDATRAQPARRRVPRPRPADRRRVRCARAPRSPPAPKRCAGV